MGNRAGTTSFLLAIVIRSCERAIQEPLMTFRLKVTNIELFLNLDINGDNKKILSKYWNSFESTLFRQNQSVASSFISF